MAGIGDGFKDIFFAGIGALAITGEKAKDLIDQLVAKGEITVDQGKQINSELKHKVAETATNVRYDVLEARMKAMSPEERAAFAAKAAEIAESANAADAQAAEAEAAATEEVVEVEAEVVGEEPAEPAEAAEAAEPEK